MRKKFTFDCSFESDLIFKHNGRIHNFGYNYNMMPFLSIWLYHRQVMGENIFRKAKFNIGKGVELETRLQETLDETVELSNKLPLDIEEFNLQLALLRLNGFGSGNFKTLYKWSLKEDGLFHLNSEEKHFKGYNGEILALDTCSDRPFLKDYLAFLKDCPHMGDCYARSSRIIDRLIDV